MFNFSFLIVNFRHVRRIVRENECNHMHVRSDESARKVKKISRPVVINFAFGFFIVANGPALIMSADHNDDKKNPLDILLIVHLAK